MKTVLMAGGKGTRIASVNSDVPKPMIPVNGIPVLEREIQCLRSQGFTEIIITVSYLGEQIMNYFGDGTGSSPVTGVPFGVNISYYYEKEPLGNAGALFRFMEELTKGEEDSFLLLNADAVFDVNFERFVEAHRSFGGLVTLFTHPNSHPYDSGLILTNEDKSVEKWLAKEDVRPRWYHNRVNAGLHVIKVSVLQSYIDSLPENDKMEISDGGIKGKRTCIVPAGKVDLDRDILKPLSATGKMYVYDSSEYVKDMGTPERYRAVCEDYEQGRVNCKNLREKQRAIFLDRDGTINQYVGFLKNIDDFELLDGVGEAIRLINESGYLAIVITNQPVIARGEVSYNELYEIHNKMETLLGKEGAYLDAIYFCPHHPDKGYEGEVAELKMECDCRKPHPGLILRASEEFNINLSDSWMIGDSKNDIMAGKQAGCRTGLISEEKTAIADIEEDSLIKIVRNILNR